MNVIRGRHVCSFLMLSALGVANAAPQAAALSEEAVKQCAEAGVAECEFQLAQLLERNGDTDTQNIRALYESAYRAGYAPAGEHVLRMITGEGGSSSPPAGVSISSPNSEPSTPLFPAPPSTSTSPLRALPPDAQVDMPAYPLAALAENREGTVTLDLEVGAEGRVHTARVYSTSGHDDLDEAALRTARNWVITGAVSEANDRSTTYRVPLVFKLDSSYWRPRLFDFYMGMPLNEFVRFVHQAQCVPSSDLPAKNCHGTYIANGIQTRIVAAFGSDLMIGAVLKFQNSESCKAAAMPLRRLNGASFPRLPRPLREMRSKFHGGTLFYWGSRSNHRDAKYALASSGIVLACGDQGANFASLGPGSTLGSSKYVDGSLLE